MNEKGVGNRHGVFFQCSVFLKAARDAPSYVQGTNITTPISGLTEVREKVFYGVR